MLYLNCLKRLEHHKTAPYPHGTPSKNKVRCGKGRRIRFVVWIRGLGLGYKLLQNVEGPENHVLSNQVVLDTDS